MGTPMASLGRLMKQDEDLHRSQHQQDPCQAVWSPGVPRQLGTRASLEEEATAM